MILLVYCALISHPSMLCSFQSIVPPVIIPKSFCLKKQLDHLWCFCEFPSGSIFYECFGLEGFGFEFMGSLWLLLSSDSILSNIYSWAKVCFTMFLIVMDKGILFDLLANIQCNYPTWSLCTRDKLVANLIFTSVLKIKLNQLIWLVEQRISYDTS